MYTQSKSRSFNHLRVAPRIIVGKIVKQSANIFRLQLKINFVDANYPKQQKTIKFFSRHCIKWNPICSRANIQILFRSGSYFDTQMNEIIKGFYHMPFSLPLCVEIEKFIDIWSHSSVSAVLITFKPVNFWYLFMVLTNTYNSLSQAYYHTKFLYSLHSSARQYHWKRTTTNPIYLIYSVNRVNNFIIYCSITFFFKRLVPFVPCS